MRSALFPAAAAMLLPLSATAAPQKDSPCKGCVVLPAASTPAPLLIVLHGDGQSATAALEPWKAAAAKRGVTLFAPQVPAKGSWWKWDGEPSFIDGQIEAIPGVDAKRIFVAGWSGGASYLGRRTRDLPKRWAAISIDGGGWAPDDLTCPTRISPAYFLVGDKNELHDLAKDLRAYWTKCGAEIVWDLVPGANHAGEWTALGKKSDTILEWMLTRPLPTSTSTSTSTSPSPSPSPNPSPNPNPNPNPNPSSNEPPAVHGGRCNCSVPGEGRLSFAPFALLAIHFLRRRTRARPRSANSQPPVD